MTNHGRTALLRTLALIAIGTAPLAAQQTGEIFYTRYNTTPGDPFRVKKATYTYTGSALQLGPSTGIATNLGADGLLFSTRGTILVAGQGNRNVCEIDPATGLNRGCSSRLASNSYHLTMDPDTRRIWTSDQPGNVVTEIPITGGLGVPTAHRLRNGATLTQIVFTPRGTFYTSSDPSGAPSVLGTLDITTWTATPRITNLAGFHGAMYDRFTGHILAFGSHFITQIDPDPVAPRVVSRLDIRTLPGGSGITAPIDQGTSDGNGLILAAVNGDPPTGGRLVFLDISTSRLVATPRFAALPPLDTRLDDIAPLSGPGCPAFGRATTFGTGWAGTSGVPTLTSTPPLINSSATLSIGNSATGPTVGCLLLGRQRASRATIWGGTLLTTDIAAELTFFVGTGGLTTNYPVPVSSCGATWFLQTVLLDRGATHGVAFSPGLELVFGN